jgi:hypothetical protein
MPNQCIRRHLYCITPETLVKSPETALVLSRGSELAYGARDTERCRSKLTIYYYILIVCTGYLHGLFCLFYFDMYIL